MCISRAGRHPLGALARNQVTAGHPICLLTASSSAVLVPSFPKQPPRLHPQSSSTRGLHPWKWCLLHQLQRFQVVHLLSQPTLSTQSLRAPWDPKASLLPTRGIVLIYGLNYSPNSTATGETQRSSTCTAIYHLCNRERHTQQLLRSKSFK